MLIFQFFIATRFDFSAFCCIVNARKQISLSIPFASERTCLRPLRTCKTSSILRRIFVEAIICFLF